MIFPVFHFGHALAQCREETAIMRKHARIAHAVVRANDLRRTQRAQRIKLVTNYPRERVRTRETPASSRDRREQHTIALDEDRVSPRVCGPSRTASPARRPSRAFCRARTFRGARKLLMSFNNRPVPASGC